MKDFDFTKIDLRGLSEKRINKVKDILATYGYRDECSLKTENVISLHVVMTVFGDDYRLDEVRDDSVFKLISYKEILNDNEILDLI